MFDLKHKHAIVIGASMGGLAAAKVLSTFFGRVSVLEVDTLSSSADPRRGTPQARHIHALLSGGRKALCELFPGFEGDLEAAGAVRLNAGLDLRFETPGFDPMPQRNLGMELYCISRPLLELVTRRRVERETNVAFLPGFRALEIVTGNDGSVATGVRCKGSDGTVTLLDGDFIIDASGRGELTLRCLEKIGLARPEESEIGIDQAYSTVTFEIPANAAPTWKAVMTMATPPKSSRLALLFPTEGNRWMVSLGGNHGDSPPADFDGFLAFAKTLRTTTIYDAIKNAKPIGEIARFAFPRSIRRHYERLSRFPSGLLPFGDALCRFNPIYGQGMSVAAQQSRILDELLRRMESSDGSYGLAHSFFKDCEPVLEGPWAVAQADFAYPKTRGLPPSDIKRRLAYVNALTHLNVIDPASHRRYVEVIHLLQPQSALVGPTIFPRVFALMIGGKSIGPALLKTYDGTSKVVHKIRTALPHRDHRR